MTVQIEIKPDSFDGEKWLKSRTCMHCIDSDVQNTYRVKLLLKL